MTKPARPEFTDYESAKAFLAAGRNPLERPTKDGWNTRVILAKDGIHLQLHGAVIATYHEDGSVLVPAPEYSHVTRTRLNRYVFEPRSMEMVYGALYYNASLAHRRGVGSPQLQIRTTWPVMIDSRGIVGEPIKVSDADLNAYIAATVQRTAEQLRAGNHRVGADHCLMCRIITTGASLNDPEHLFAHVWDHELPINFIAHVGGVPIMPHGGGKHGVDEQHIKALTTNLTDYLTGSFDIVRS